MKIKKINENSGTYKKTRLVKCRSCGNEVSRAAEMCPKCGDKSPNGSGCVKFIGYFMLAIIGILIIGYLLAFILAGFDVLTELINELIK